MNGTTPRRGAGARGDCMRSIARHARVTLGAARLSASLSWLLLTLPSLLARTLSALYIYSRTLPATHSLSTPLATRQPCAHPVRSSQCPPERTSQSGISSCCFSLLPFCNNVTGCHLELRSLSPRGVPGAPDPAALVHLWLDGRM